jgi:hypothetical protein
MTDLPEPGAIAAASSLFSARERQLLAEVVARLAGLDRYAEVPLSRCFLRIVKAFAAAGRRDMRPENATHLAELSLQIDVDALDAEGRRFSEVRLQYRRRSLSVIARKARDLFGEVPPARVLVLTPGGYRLTARRTLETKRFQPSGQPRLAAYKPSSIANLARFLLGTFEPQLPPPARAPRSSKPATRPGKTPAPGAKTPARSKRPARSKPPPSKRPTRDRG